MKEFCRLSEFERGDFYSLSNKIVLNQTINKKDFSECSIRQVKFSNCIFDWTSFPCTKCEDLTFERCILQNASFKKSELENFIFNNCQLTNINFARSDLMNFDFINCKLNDVYFSAGQLTDLKIDNSQLQDVWFSGSLLDNVKIKNSTLEKIRFDGAEVYKETYKNGVLITNRTPINDYTSFLKEIRLFSAVSTSNLPYEKLIYRSFRNLAGILGLGILLIFYNIFNINLIGF